MADMYGDVTSVSCPSSAFCGAVDAYGNVFTYAGTAGWSKPVKIDTYYVIEAVSCPSPSFCPAVDFRGKVAPTRAPPGPLPTRSIPTTTSLPGLAQAPASA